MNIKNLFAGAAIAAMLPMVANAALIDITDDPTDGVATSLNLSDILHDDIFKFSESDNSYPIALGNVAMFDFVNDTGKNLKLFAGLPASTNPGLSQTPNATFSFDGGAPEVLNNNTIFTVVLAGDTAEFELFFGDPGNGSQTDVTFDVQAIPVPAAGFLLLGGLGGLAALKRRKKA